MKRIIILSLIALLVMAFASTAMAKAPSQVSMQAKVASFDFLVDYSGSMMMKHKTINKEKFAIGKAAFERVNARIPELGYSGSIHTFATDMEILPQQVYNREAYARGIAKLHDTYEVFNRLTPMGDGINHWSNALYSTLAKPTAVIIISDGENNRGMDATAAAQAALAANSGLCFHIISVADSVEGQTILDNIASLRPNCSVSVKAIDLIDSDAAVEQFVRDVFYGGGKIVLRSVLFAFDSSAITHDSAAVLDELATIIKGNQRNVEIGGHTCSIGTEQYNQGLSERRANAVRSYLVKKGIPSNSIKAVGYGKLNPKYDNRTEEGRRLNRRAEIDFI